MCNFSHAGKTAAVAHCYHDKPEVSTRRVEKLLDASRGMQAVRANQSMIGNEGMTRITKPIKSNTSELKGMKVK